jgi:hypothetical protein
MLQMHLDLIDGPFMFHILISIQDFPVPLLKFQMASRLKILMASKSKTGKPDILLFSLKGPAKRTSSRFPKRAPMEREAHLQGICISTKSSSFGFHSKGPLPEDPLRGIPRRELSHH